MAESDGMTVLETNSGEEGREKVKTHWTLKQFFTNQLKVDDLQLDYMLEYYLSCHKRHMKQRDDGTIYSPSLVEKDFDDFLDVIDRTTRLESGGSDCDNFPRAETDNDKPLKIGEEGWHILSHYMQPLFKNQDGIACMKPTCEICLEHDYIGQAFEKFKSEREGLFEGTSHYPLSLFEKYVGCWIQESGFSQYELSDIACARAFANGFVNCPTLSHFQLNGSIFGEAKDTEVIVCLLNALEKSSISSISLQNFTVENDTVLLALTKMLRNMKDLKVLTISTLSLSNSNYNTEIIDALVENSVTELIIEIEEETNGNFRFLEHVSSTDLKKLASKTSLTRFLFTSYNFTFPIDYCYFFEEVLKSKSIKYLQYHINDIPGIERAEDEVKEYQQFMDNLYNPIERIEEFHFKKFMLLNARPQHCYHIVKHCKNTTDYSPTLDFLQVANDQEVISTSEVLNVQHFVPIGLSRIIPYLNRVTQVTVKLTLMDNEQLQTFSRAILDAPLLENLALTKVGKVGKHALFTDYFKVQNNSKLRKIILSDVGTNTVDAVSTFLDLDFFPNLTALHFRGSQMEFGSKSCEILIQSLKKQESYYPKGLRKLEIVERCITSYEVTEYLLRSLTDNRLLTTLIICQAPIKNVDALVDFVLYNKTLTKLQLYYSDCDELPEMELLCKDNEATPSFLKVFGAFQLNWQLLTIDWFSAYHFCTFEFGTIDHVAYRFLVERIMNRNKEQKHINSLMQPILSQKFKQLSDVSIISRE